MSMAVVCAQVSFFGPSVGSVAGKGFGSRKGYASLTCRASSGGTRRDYEKILAREQKRRVREYFAPLRILASVAQVGERCVSSAGAQLRARLDLVRSGQILLQLLWTQGLNAAADEGFSAAAEGLVLVLS